MQLPYQERVFRHALFSYKLESTINENWQEPYGELNAVGTKFINNTLWEPMVRLCLLAVTYCSDYCLCRKHLHCWPTEAHVANTWVSIYCVHSSIFSPWGHMDYNLSSVITVLLLLLNRSRQAAWHSQPSVPHHPTQPGLIVKLAWVSKNDHGGCILYSYDSTLPGDQHKCWDMGRVLMPLAHSCVDEDSLSLSLSKGIRAYWLPARWKLLHTAVCWPRCFKYLKKPVQ